MIAKYTLFNRRLSVATLVAFIVLSVFANVNIGAVKAATGASARLNVKDVYLNLRSTPSVHIASKMNEKDNPILFTYDGTYLTNIPAMHIKEEIFTESGGDLAVAPAHYIGTLHQEWYGELLTNMDLAGADGEVRKGADRLFRSLDLIAFVPFREGGSAKLSEADKNIDGVACDEYQWKTRGGQHTACVIRDSLLPVTVHTILDTFKLDVTYDRYNDPKNVFKLPHNKGTGDFTLSDAYMALHSLKNFQYKITLLFQSGKAEPQLDATIQGTYLQDNMGVKASEWGAKNDLSKAPIKRYLQIGRLRWTAPADEKKPYVKAAAWNPSARIFTNDKLMRTHPFLVWIAMINSPEFSAPGEKSGTTTFEGEAATEYTFTGAKGGKITMVVLDKSSIPVHVELTAKEGGRNDIIIWDIVSMNDSAVTIEAPAK